MIALLFFVDLETAGSPLSVSTFPSGFVNDQAILSRKTVIMAVAYPI